MTDDEITEARDRVRSHRDKAVKLTALMAYANKTAEGLKEMGDDARLADDASMLAQRTGVRIVPPDGSAALEPGTVLFRSTLLAAGPAERVGQRP